MKAREPLVGAWLLAICALVVAMIAVGGLTRLTDSGLSITEWDLAKGLIPPLSQTRWAEEFALYQRTTEYQVQNAGMSLAEFQRIYWWEWGHRFLGKVLGAAFAGPFLFFALTRRLRGRLWPVLGLFGLGALQGGVGWWMVTSGLWSGLDVSPLRLAVHLGMAFAILGLAFWLALDALGWPRTRAVARAPTTALAVLLALLLSQILLGAVLAGADGGRAYADWPTIGGELWPDSAFGGALLENHATQHLLHRTLGYLVAFGAILAAWAGLRANTERALFLTLGATALAQVVLGVATVVNAAPMGLSVAHQMGAVALWLCAVAGLRVTRSAVTAARSRPMHVATGHSRSEVA